MTKRTRRANQQVGTLQTLLVVGSLAATLVGTRLLALQAPPEPQTAVVPAAPVEVVVPAETTTNVPLPPDSRGVQIELPEIPQVVQPNIQPVARTRSSR